MLAYHVTTYTAAPDGGTMVETRRPDCRLPYGTRARGGYWGDTGWVPVTLGPAGYVYQLDGALFGAGRLLGGAARDGEPAPRVQALAYLAGQGFSPAEARAYLDALPVVR